MSSPTFGSLFTGVGGFDMGMEQAGWECLFQVEWDEHCIDILERHWGDTPRWKDVRGVNGAQVPPVDCLIFGSPCQDLSVAGARAGLSGERSGLFLEAMRIIKEMRNATQNQYPKWAIWENVPGAISSNKGRDFGTVLHEMAETGALELEWGVLDAQYFGVPQRRRRIFVIACYDPAIAGRCPDQILPISEGLPRHIEEGKQKRQETSAKIDEGVIGEAIVFENSYRDAARIAKDGITQTLSAKMGTGGNNVPMLSFDTQFGSNANVFEEHSPTLKASQQPPSVMFYDGYNQKLDGSGIHRSLRTGRDSGDFVAQESEVQTIIRRLTPIECERLMGWPDDHTKWKSNGKQQADSHRYKQVGNGVATPVAKWIGQNIMSIHTKKD